MYTKKISSYNNLITALLFFIANFSTAVLLLIVQKYLYLKNPAVFFQTISEMILLLPIMVILLIVLTLILYLGAVILGGQGSFVDSMKVVSFSSVPVIFIFLPQLNILAFIFWVYLLTLAFHHLHQYKIRKAVLNILFPFLVIFIFMIVIGFFNFYPFLEKIQNFT